MKEVTPFNPVLSSDLNLSGGTTPPAQPQAKSARTKSAPRKRARIARTRRVLEVPQATGGFVSKVGRKARVSWQRIKCGIATRIARLDSDKVKRVLLACGIAGTVALLIIALAKLTPLLVAVLALLGLGVLLRLWDRLRSLPVPA